MGALFLILLFSLDAVCCTVIFRGTRQEQAPFSVLLKNKIQMDLVFCTMEVNDNNMKLDSYRAVSWSMMQANLYGHWWPHNGVVVFNGGRPLVCPHP